MYFPSRGQGSQQNEISNFLETLFSRSTSVDILAYGNEGDAQPAVSTSKKHGNRVGCGKLKPSTDCVGGCQLRKRFSGATSARACEPETASNGAEVSEKGDCVGAEDGLRFFSSPITVGVGYHSE